MSLFTPEKINTLTLKNRIVRSATWEGMCTPQGEPTEKLIQYYRDLAQGGTGLIISGYTYVSPEGQQLPGKMGIYTDTFKDAHCALTEAVHQAGGKIAVQLVHAGGQANGKTTGMATVAPSAVEADQYGEKPEELTPEDIQRIIKAFADGAQRAKDWGFDAVQLHGAHGYLINQFLSPLTNQRTDEWGGSLENRCRFLEAVYKVVRSRVGDDYPVFIKLNVADHVEGGLSEADGLAIAQRLSQLGMDALEISSGTPASGNMGPARPKINAPEKEAYNLGLAKAVKEKVSCPVICVGGFRSQGVAQAAVTEGGMDFIALSRPLIAEPDLPKRWEADPDYTAYCISCSKCFMPGLRKGGIACVVKEKAKKQ
ncbi:MAG: NADH:flavin oxidoreductase [Desulfobacterales bacterium]|nr:NADH:flavin oxidoreductase [Desulfobacterales bacterium]